MVHFKKKKATSFEVAFFMSFDFAFKVAGLVEQGKVTKLIGRWCRKN